MKIVIDSNNPRINGEYELDTEHLTNRELHLIKKHAGVRAGELAEAFEAGDNDLAIVFGYIAMQRHGLLDIPIDALWDLEIGKLTVDFSDEEAKESDALPPLQEPGSNASEAGSNGSSSPSSPSTSAPSLASVPPSPTGNPG